MSFYPYTIVHLQGLISHQNVNNSEFSLSDNVHIYIIKKSHTRTA
jgi:hypothetical protein